MSGQLGTQFQLFVKGLRNETLSFEVHKDATVDEFFKLLEDKTKVPAKEARLIHAGKELVQGQQKRLSDYPAILHGSTLFMVLRLHGGGTLA